MKTAYRLSIIVCSLFSSIANAASSYPHFELTPNIDISRITGFMQTPKGGTLNSTSIKRPSFEEIGKRYHNRYDFEMATLWDEHRISLGYTNNRFHRNVTLKQDLMTHNQFLAAGTFVRFKMGFDWSRGGYEYRYTQNAHSHLGIIGELAYLKSRYQFRAPTTGSSRSFGGISPRVGLSYYRHYASGLASRFTFISSIPGISNASILTTGFELTKHLCDNKNQSIAPQFAPQLGFGYHRINSKDGQRVPNHIRYQSLPYLRLGLKMRF